VTLAALTGTGDPKRDVPVYDTLLKRNVTRGNRDLLAERYGQTCTCRRRYRCACQCLYAAAKRQLDSRTLRKHGLAA
jgi:hypothetical protein